MLKNQLRYVKDAKKRESEKYRIKAALAAAIFLSGLGVVLSVVTPIFYLFLPGVSWLDRGLPLFWLGANVYIVFMLIGEKNREPLRKTLFYVSPLPKIKWGWIGAIVCTTLLPFLSCFFLFLFTIIFLRKGVWVEVETDACERAQIVLNDERTEFLLRLAAEIDAWNESVVFLQRHLDFSNKGLIRCSISKEVEQEYRDKHAVLSRAISTANSLMNEGLLGKKPMIRSEQRGLVSSIPLVDYGPVLPNILHELDEAFV